MDQKEMNKILKKIGISKAAKFIKVQVYRHYLNMINDIKYMVQDKIIKEDITVKEFLATLTDISKAIEENIKEEESDG